MLLVLIYGIVLLAALQPLQVLLLSAVEGPASLSMVPGLYSLTFPPLLSHLLTSDTAAGVDLAAGFLTSGKSGQKF